MERFLFHRQGVPWMLRPLRRSTFLRSFFVLTLLFLSSAGLFLTDHAAAATLEKAWSADAFVDSIGVATHLGYTDTAYGNYPMVKQRLQELGIRHIRDGGPADKMIDLASLGIHSDLVVDLAGANINLNPPPAGTTPGTVYPGCIHSDRSCYFMKDYLAQFQNALDQVEGQNEYDLFNGSYPITNAFQPYPQSYYGNTGWVGVLCNYMQQLHDTLRSDSQISLPIVAPSFGENAGPSYVTNTCGNFASNWVDYVNLHDYVGAPMAPGIEANTTLLGKLFPNRPFQATETGWNTTRNAAQPITETVQGKYIPRLLFEQVNHNIVRTYTYEFVDEWSDPNNSEANFGLLRNDFSPKPAYTAEQNLIRLLSDPGAPIDPGSLDFSISGASSVHHTLLQKRDGTFYLALWNDIKSTDSDVTTPVTVTFHTPLARVESYLPNASTSVVDTSTSPSTLNVDVPDKVLLLKMTPTTLQPPGPGVPPVQPTPCPGGACPQPTLPPPPPPPSPLPDLVVSNIRLSTDKPVQGQPIRITATVRNIGAGPTPEGIIIGVAFTGPGGLLNFEDTYTSSLSPGATVDLTSNLNMDWTPKAGGLVTITAVVDDVNRMPESNDTNNALTKPFKIATTSSIPTNVSTISGNSKSYLDWAGTTTATSYNVKRTVLDPTATPVAVAPMVAAYAQDYTSAINLTTEGAADWAHWGLSSASSFDHKSGVTSQISNYTIVNAGYTSTFSDGPNYTWSDGTPTASATTNSGVYLAPWVPDSGFSFTVPADPQPRMLKVYFGTNQAQIKFRASLSDGSAPDFSSESFSPRYGVYTLIYSAASAGQTLKVSLTEGGFSGNVNLYAATLSNPVAFATPQTIARKVQQTWYDDISVTPGTPYFYAVTANTASGESPSSGLSVAVPISGSATLSPILECVAKHADNTYTAYFGYQNTGTAPVRVVIGGANKFTPGPSDRGQPIIFSPGRTPAYPKAAFSIDFSGSKLVWQLGTHTATASSSSQACPVATLEAYQSPGVNTVDLTTEGTRDWVHWGINSSSDFDHKAGVDSQISNYTVVGAGYVGQFGDALTTYNWTDGTPTANASTHTGIFLAQWINNSGFSITVPADTQKHTLKLYLGVYQAQMKLQAHLSDNIASDYVDTTFLNRISRSNVVYTITFQASKPGQRLTITMTNQSNTGNINLQAATLS